MSNGCSATTPYTSTHRVTVAVDRQICEESSGRFAGPMKPVAFMKKFMPVRVKGKIPAHAAFRTAQELKRETAMYDPFVAVCRQLDPDGRMLYHNSSDTPDPQTATPGDPQRPGHNPDVMFYSSDRLPESTPTTDFARAELFGEFKYSILDDPFVDVPDPEYIYRFPFESSTDRGRDTRGQIAAYASAVFQLQFRTFVFSFLIIGNMARFIRWDRSGAIVTERFDYTKQPRIMAEFIWRYGFLTGAQRGHDESVRALPLDKGPFADYAVGSQALRERIGGRDREILLLRMSPFPGSLTSLASTSSSEQPAEFLPPSGVAPEANDADGWDYYVLAPSYRDRVPFGKATRSMFVYDRRARQVRHLKDTHRIPLDQYTIEHRIMEELRQKGVQHIATVHCCWDVAPHGECYDTVSPEYYGTFGDETAPERADDEKGRTPLRMYRLISNEMGTELWKFESWKEVVQVIVDILKALDGAEEAGIRHRDLSVGNIMIWNGRGLLIDWDASQYVVKMNKGLAERPDQTGTWQFISVRRLRDVSAPHERADDIESVFWVLLWLGFKFSRHTIGPDALKCRLERTFDDISPAAKGHKGGAEKECILRSTRDYPLYTKFQPHMLQQVLDLMHDVFSARYNIPKRPKAVANTAIEQRAQRRYEEDLLDYEADKIMWSDGRHLREALEILLEDGGWPADDVDDGPHENLIPADSEPATQKRSLGRESAMEVSAIAERRSPKGSKATKTSKGKNSPIATRANGPRKRRRLNGGAGRGASLSTVQERDE